MRTLKILIATHNAGKMREIRALLSETGLQLIGPEEVGLKIEVAEAGSSYAENAAIKAKAYADGSGLLTLADDSGLEVDALGGEPGLRSARFTGKSEATDADRRRFLLLRLDDMPRPWSARFRCLVALAQPGDEAFRFAEGICEGEIIPEERGQNGFGYDPIFLIPSKGKTMAELSLGEKNLLSHRSRAIRAAWSFLKQDLAIP